MPPFRDEHILIIAPGSQTTLAQLGLPESFTPAKWRFPTRMFPAEKNGEWEPTKVLQKPKAAINGTTNGGHVNAVSTDIEMNDAPNGTLPHIETEAPAVQPPEDTASTTEAFEEDPASIEGAAYPLKGGHVEDWTCFFALLTHIYNTLSPPFHTPVLVISQPCWTARDHELLTQFFFETFKIPAFCLMDSALATCYAYGVESATVIDVGHEKCDVTAVAGFVAYDTGRGVAVPGCGGHDMTRRLHELLQQKEFTEDMCEQLKKSPVCEILPASADMPHEEQASNPAAAASTGAMDSGANAIAQDGIAIGQVPRGPGAGTEVGQEGGNGDDDDNEGVLDVASIVAKGNASEFLAKREAEKAAKAAAKKAASAEAARPVRLRNAERQTAMFSYQEIVATGDHGTDSNGVSLASRKRKRDVEVGIERFMAASAPKGCNDGVLDTIAATIHNAVLAVPQIEHRSQLWENLIILGNGSRVRGFTPALLSTLSTRYTLSPSSATIFTSELPSNFSTPIGTPGTNTPVPGHASSMHHPAAHGVNPLLVAATRHANQQLQPQQHSLQVPGGGGAPDPNQQQQHMMGRHHSQTPTSIKTVKAPEYFPEWRDPSVAGMEEAGFLGAQVAAKVLFVVDGGISKGFLTRGEYNDLGPAGIHDCAM